MKKILTIMLLSCLFMCACADPAYAPKTADEAIELLQAQNIEYVRSGKNGGDISAAIRKETAENGQKPYAVIITCSDSRVPAEHIFSAGIGELFIIRTAGNVIGKFELGSVEYGAEHLGCKLVVVLGHTSCGAVAATLEGGATGNIKAITDAIGSALPEDCDARAAEILNVENSIAEIGKSEIIRHLEHESGLKVVGAIYDIESGMVEFLEK